MDNSWNQDYPNIAREAGFKLRRCKEGKLDWRLLGAIDIDGIVHSQQYERLDNLTQHIAEAPLAKVLDSNVLESGVAKYFLIAQLCVQYLLFCRKFLDDALCGLKRSINELRTENVQLKELNKEGNEELLKLHKKLHKIEEINQIIFPCSMCPKNFISNDMLDTHIKRHHSKLMPNGKSIIDNDKNLLNAIKLEMEIKLLKERLNAAEQAIHKKQDNNVNAFVENTENMKIDTETETELLQQTCTVSTQTEISTRNIGIQSNLEEPKELDETISNNPEENKNLEQEVLNELRDKLKLLEEWKSREVLNNAQSIDLIKTQIETMVSSVDEKLKELQTVGKVQEDKAVITQEDIRKMQSTFSENLEKLCQDSELKLFGAIKSFEQGYKTKLEGLENLIGKCESSMKAIVIETATKNDSNQGVQMVKCKQVQVKTNETANETDDSESDQIQVPLTPNVVVKASLNDSESEEETSSSGTEETEESAPECQIPDKIVHRQPQRPTTAVKSKKVIEQKEVQVVRQKASKETLRQAAVNLFRKRLKMFGISKNTKTLSNRAKVEIEEKMMERRNSYRKKNPKYFATRNRLKQSVEKIARERMQAMEEVKNKHRTGKARKPGVTSSADQQNRISATDSSQSYDTESDESDKETEKRLSQAQPMTSTNTSDIPIEQIEALTTRLERILASPIRKPITFTRAPSVIPNGAEPDDSPANDNLKKPIPTPRKKVMFDVKGTTQVNGNPVGLNKISSQNKPTENPGEENDKVIRRPVLGSISSTESSSISSLLK